jgi:hypothetical protein
MQVRTESLNKELILLIILSIFRVAGSSSQCFSEVDHSQKRRVGVYWTRRVGELDRIGSPCSKDALVE